MWRKTKPQDPAVSPDFWQDEEVKAGALLISILDNLPDMVFLKDAEELRFVYINTAGGKLLGYAPSDFIGKTDFDIFPDDIAHNFVDQDRQTLKKGIVTEINQEPVTTRTGELRYLQTKKAPLSGQHGEKVYLLGISRDITEQIRLRRKIDELRNLEQERIASDLHDSLGQTLTGLAIKARVLEECLAKNINPPVEEIRKIIWMANHATEQARAIARGMDPVVLNEGLLSALKDLAASTSENYGVACTFKASEEWNNGVDKHTASQLYRIAQEAINNAIRHGKAGNIGIRLENTGDHLIMTVSDDGCGMAGQDQFNPGMGMRNMDHRAMLIGATLEVRANNERGVTVICRQRKDTETPPPPQPVEAS